MERTLTAFMATFLFAAGCAHAQQLQFGDWTTGVYEGYTEASTSNASGSLVGMLCGVEQQACLYYLTTSTTCEKGSQTPVLINSDTGSNATWMDCEELVLGANVTYLNTFADFDVIHDIMLSANQVGFAIPLQGGEFHVARFSLAGSNQAILRAVEEGEVESPAPADEVL